MRYTADVDLPPADRRVFHFRPILTAMIVSTSGHPSLPRWSRLRNIDIASMPSPDLQCAQCAPPKKFRRREHLLRHLASHTNKGPFACMYCTSSFKNSDSLKRHLKICKSRLQSRDGCSTSHLLCPFPFSQPTGNNLATTDELPFMRRMAIGAGLAECFGSGRGPRRTSVTDQDFPDDLSVPVMIPSAEDDLKKLCPELADDLLQSSTADIWRSFTTNADSDALAQCVFVDPLEAVTTTIALTLQELVESQDTVTNSIVEIEWSTLMDGQCTRFFSPNNIRKFLDLFWSHWYPVFPIMHRVTFDIQNTPVPLLISMLLVGAQFSPDEDDRRACRIWLRTNEALVFDDPCFRDAVDGFTPLQTDSACSMQLLQHVQAALLMCVCQSWEGRPESKLRIRHYRYGDIVAVARYLHPASASHKNLDPDPSSFNWCDFIETEETIRTLHFIFFLDSLFMIIHKTPPRMAMRELKMDLVCPEELFQAKSSEMCLRRLQAYREKSVSAGNSISVDAAVKQICSTDKSGLQSLAHLDKYNLFTLICAIHVSIHYLQASIVLPETLAPITNALDNWKHLWHTTNAAASRNARSINHGVEFWVLASALVQGLQNEDESAQDYDTPDMRSLPGLLQSFHLQE
ncbi:hypothetical protein ASPWEDRAFT_166131 [Aspergillus wentii DTO 134E9]|uniref:C2H2-type domain-containing protein n=1 Tax=Aspergillus wentii DTO 134E9 TaxID=1073089 RepID=A0A1L9RYU5_ASPWE|nr:uncharacterized protein ASPWEDRAFT_166131 [Aspergillus wentii DTO 134E9]KAI9932477.1 hypothetical protein MW887_008718 [Aspergillus wentii]OJJ40044.1 hypothetical protein ASPWEDRAFT_166131 [Aspergillus wentii DTO 134E9]